LPWIRRRKGYIYEERRLEEADRGPPGGGDQRPVRSNGTCFGNVADLLDGAGSEGGAEVFLGSGRCSSSAGPK